MNLVLYHLGCIMFGYSVGTIVRACGLEGGEAVVTIVLFMTGFFLVVFNAPDKEK